MEKKRDRVEKYIFKMFGLEILPSPNVPLSRLDSHKAVSRKCGFSCANFLHCLGDLISGSMPMTLPLDLCGSSWH